MLIDLQRLQETCTACKVAGGNCDASVTYCKAFDALRGTTVSGGNFTDGCGNRVDDCRNDADSRCKVVDADCSAAVTVWKTNDSRVIAAVTID